MASDRQHTRTRSGPTCVRQLAEMGARVVKVESREQGTAGTAALMMDEVLRGKPGYEWTLNHVVAVRDPLELFRLAVEDVA